MAARFPHANHLTNEEVQYELMLRGKVKETGDDLKSQQRLLRLLFKQDVQEGREYKSPFTFEQELEIVQNRVYPLLDSLRKKADGRVASRLWHYYHRLNRTSPGDEAGSVRRRELLDEMELVLLGPTGQTSSTMLDMLEAGDTETAGGFSGKVDSGTREKGAKPKQSANTTERKPSYEDLERRIRELEALVLQSGISGSHSQDDREKDVGQFPRFRKSSGTETETTVRSNRRTTPIRLLTKYPHSGSDTDPEDPRLPANRDRRDFENRRRQTTEEDDYPMSYDDRRDGRYSRHRRRIEFWKISFSGDNRVISVENFLFKLKKIALREGVPKRELLRDIHLILEGQASDWFFTYVDDFENWEQFEEKLRYRFGNPNQDQGIRLKMQERKQLRGESFMAFLTDMERLNKMRSRPLSKKEKFEMVWDNMRQHYRSKISIVKVRDLDHLIELNHGIDAADPILQGGSESKGSRPIHHIEYVDSDYSEVEQEGIDAIQARQENRYPRAFHSRQAQEQRTAEQGQGGANTDIWNPSIPRTEKVPTDLQNYDPINQIHTIKIESRKCPYLKVNIFDTELTALLDSGAGISVINSLDIAERYGLKLQPTKLRVCTADRTEYKCLGYLNIPFTYRKITKVVPTVVVPEISKPILGCNFWRSFGIMPMADLGKGPEKIGEFDESEENITFTLEPIGELPRLSIKEEDSSLDVPTIDIPETQPIPSEETVEIEHDLNEMEKNELMEVIKQFDFTSSVKLGRTNAIEHEIVLKEGAKPKNQPVYRCAPNLQKEIDAEIERFKSMDVIEECYSEWTNPLVPVRKSNGKIRVCLDSRRLNSMTVKDAYPMRNMLEIFQRLESAKYFSIIDLKDAYFQIPLKEECRNLTAFRTSRGLFRFKVCPFGVTGASFCMNRLMDRVIGFDLIPFVFVYLDDIVIASKTLEDHFRLLKIVAERLKKANLTVSLEKSRFCRRQIKYLGYLLNDKGIAIDGSRISAILDYARPKCVKDIRRLLGLAGFYQRFIKGYSRKTVPITDLLKKSKKKFTWTEEAEVAFMDLKSALTAAPILANPDFSKQFTIESDASDTAVGAALVQDNSGETQVIAYFSKKLSRTQRAYSSVEKECLGVLLAIENFRHYVEGSRFKVVTDARSLLWLFTIGAGTGNSKLIRWALKIQSYDIQLEYRKGSSNITADCLSRSVDLLDTYADDKYSEEVQKILNNPTKFPDFRITDGKIFKYAKFGN
ncbi:uncharacterized protein LOC129752806 [Uranotaenia lowii]|uniref:uncharacterized protein LOC129752806 n=1 Tax=Uranotaenia lowii TaxID=190385 RepID=UPI002479CFC5|nr:uncharacterized protein LOC129752806 [Uranotaenia lowii]